MANFSYNSTYLFMVFSIKNYWEYQENDRTRLTKITKIIRILVCPAINLQSVTLNWL